jgi:hypothetical protein
MRPLRIGPAGMRPAGVTHRGHPCVRPTPVVALRAVAFLLASAPAAHAQARPSEPGGGGPAPRRIVCVTDAATGAPVVDPVLERQTSVGWRRTPRAEGDARLASWCRSIDALLPPWRVRRLGYAPTEVRAGQAAGTGSRDDGIDTLWVRLVPLAALLPASVTREVATGGERNAVALDVATARVHGVTTTGALLSLLPFAQPRSARGEVSVSLRGTRREQVAVTLDGLPLTDPATGLADVGDVPLAILGGATVAPGSDPLGAGPGAVGGVLALHTGDGSHLASRVGAFGTAQVEAAHTRRVGASRLRFGASHQSARNDFPFRNTASTTGQVFEERRVNNDARRDALFAQWRGDRVQVVALGTQGTHGLVGPVNVRDYDEDRARARRAFVRASGAWGGAQLSVGARAFSLDYRDPQRPVFDTDADAVAVDVEAQRVIGSVRWLVGLGGDRLRTSDGTAQDRTRAHVALAHRARVAAFDLNTGLRVDAVEGTGAQPTGSLAIERAWPDARVGLRLAQAVRVPTLYDLYFSSPQRLTVRALRPERVTIDAELFARGTAGTIAGGRVSAQGALVARSARDAIVWFPGNFGWSPANVGRETLRGLEARATWDHARAHASAWGTWYDATLTTGALRIPTPYVARESAGLLARMQHGVVTLSATARAFGRRPFTSGPRDAAFELPAVALLDVAAAWAQPLRARGGTLLVTVGLENATDVAWESVRGFPAIGRSWSVAASWTP